MLRLQARDERRRAATAVEFAVVSLLFFGILLGAVEISRGLMVDHLLKNAARQACREGVVPGRSTADIEAAADAAMKRSALPEAYVVVKVNGTPGEASSAKSGDRITVAVTVPVGRFSWVPGTRYLPATLGGSYTLRRE